MGRELSMSLTSVVLEAINTVEQDTSKYHSMSGHQQRPLQRNDHHDSPRGGGEQKKRPSSERFSRRPHTAESGQHRAVHQQRPRAASGTNARPDTAGNGPPQHRRVARREKVNSPRGGGGGQHKEDEGLADLDMREEEFRKVSEGGKGGGGFGAEGVFFLLFGLDLRQGCFNINSCFGWWVDRSPSVNTFFFFFSRNASAFVFLCRPST